MRRMLDPEQSSRRKWLKVNGKPKSARENVNGHFKDLCSAMGERNFTSRLRTGFEMIGGGE